MLDFSSLLLGTAISGLCLSVTMLAFWISSRGSRFMVTWSIGVVLIVAHLVSFWIYAQNPSPYIGAFAAVLLPLGATVIYMSVRQFADGRISITVPAAISVLSVAVVPTLFLVGLDGVGLIVQNFLVAGLFGACAVTFWSNRQDTPIAAGTMAGLYGILVTSFVLCGGVLLLERQWTLGIAPSNWAENLNIVLSVICMSGIGALTLSIDQSRIAGRHRSDAMTDQLTGLTNRRGLYAMHAADPFGPRKALVLFDLDHFKRVNDEHGHAVGDVVLQEFGAVMLRHSRRADLAVRLGGEEFALVMPDVSPEQARHVAEAIGAAFAATPIATGSGVELRCTVSAGIAFGDALNGQIADVFARADRALYAAKSGGRSRVESSAWRLVG